MNAMGKAHAAAGIVAMALAPAVVAYPDKPTFRELGYDGVDGTCRGIGVPKSTPRAVRKQVSKMMDALDKDPGMHRAMAGSGFAVAAVNLEMLPASMKARTQGYFNSAKTPGLVK